jgi:hypothetical protein
LLIAANKDTTIIGSNPVWMDNDWIAYKGCNNWNGGGQFCGIYTVPSWSTASAGSTGENPAQLAGVDDGSATPTDTRGDWLLYQSNKEGDWEVYRVSTRGGTPLNLSNSHDSNDGLGAFSPDGQWAAFVSNREGQWAVWLVAAASGKEPRKLFDLSSNPWISGGGHDWFNERISWGQ